MARLPLWCSSSAPSLRDSATIAEYSTLTRGSLRVGNTIIKPGCTTSRRCLLRLYTTYSFRFSSACISRAPPCHRHAGPCMHYVPPNPQSPVLIMTVGVAWPCALLWMSERTKRRHTRAIIPIRRRSSGNAPFGMCFAKIKGLAHISCVKDSGRHGQMAERSIGAFVLNSRGRVRSAPWQRSVVTNDVLVLTSTSPLTWTMSTGIIPIQLRRSSNRQEDPRGSPSS